MLRSVQKVFPLVLLVVLFFLTSDGVCEDGLVVGASGNVGIGTETPGSKLHIVGPAITGSPWLAEVLCFSSQSYPTQYCSLWIDMSGASGGMSMGVTGARSLYIAQNTGNIGIGTTTPAAKMDVNGTVQVLNQLRSTLGNDLYLNANGPNRDVFFQVNGSTMMIVHGSTGNVGIGSISPSYKLDVNGTIRGNNVSPSDIRWKTNINTIDNSLEKVSQLRGVTYEWTDPSKGDGQQIGVIAQEVEQVFPEVISTDNQGYKSVEYSKLVAPLIEAVKELKKENEKLKKRIAALEKK